MTPEEMRRNGDTEPSIAYWLTRKVAWNGEEVTTEAPSKAWPVNQTDED